MVGRPLGVISMRLMKKNQGRRRKEIFAYLRLSLMAALVPLLAHWENSDLTLLITAIPFKSCVFGIYFLYIRPICWRYFNSGIM